MGCPPLPDAVSSKQAHSSSICPCASIRQVDSLRLSEDHPPSVRIFAYFHAHSGVAVGFFAPCVRPRCCGPPPVSEICSQPNFRIRRNHIWVLIMQKTFRQDFINRKAIKNTGQLPMYLIENHHEGIVRPQEVQCGAGGDGAAQGGKKSLQESLHRSFSLHQPLRPLGPSGVRRVRNAVPPLHMDAPRWKVRRVALCEPSGLRQEILPQLAHAG